MGSCSQRSCSSRSNIDKKSSGISFHRFPKDPERRDIWIKFVNRGKWKPTKYSVLCSKHFLEKDIDRTSLSSTRLKDTAVPIAYITQMECKEDMKDYRNEQISTCIKDETDSLKEYNIKVQSEVEENHLKSSNGQEYVLHEDFSDGIKIENNILDDLTNEIKVEIKKELEEYSMEAEMKETSTKTTKTDAPKRYSNRNIKARQHKCEICFKQFSQKISVNKH